MIGVAVNETLVPAHTAPLGLAAIEILGVTLVVTVIVILLDVTTAGDGQVAVEVISTVIISPLANADEE